MLNAKLTF